jgi:hypothetical protein
MSTIKAPEKRKPWREVLPVHPEADLYPLLAKTDPAALKRLGEDIKNNGLQLPIVILREGPPAGRIERDDRANYKLADGRNRLDAMAAVGIPFKLVWGKPKGARYWDWRLVTTDIGLPDKGAVETVMHHDNPAALVASLNLHRRHLKPEERHEKLVRLLKLHPEKSNRAISADTGIPLETVRRARKKTPDPNGSPEKRVGKDGKAYSMPTPRGLRADANIHREMKLGKETFAKIEGTSLGTAREMDALIELNRGGDPDQLTPDAQWLVEDAVAGKNVSAVAVWRDPSLSPFSPTRTAIAAEAGQAMPSTIGPMPDLPQQETSGADHTAEAIRFVKEFIALLARGAHLSLSDLANAVTALSDDQQRALVAVADTTNCLAMICCADDNANVESDSGRE